jgi:two-component system, OmpR family, phosphate regulon sensor histidine kinase PhoR
MAGLALAISLAIGLYFGAQWGWTAAAILLFAIVLYHLRNVSAISRWLSRADSPDPPRTFGVWDRLHAQLHHSRREAAKREAELAQSNERWRAAARALPDGVVIVAGERIEWANDTAADHWALDPARDPGTAITHLVRSPEFIEYFAKGDYSRPLALSPPQRPDRMLSVQVVPYAADRRLVLSRDVTQFRQVERMRREFVANVSHELRTPLTVIAGFLETLRDEHDPEAAARYVELMQEQAKRMERLVEDLLTLSTLESAPPPPLDQPIDMANLVDRLGADARALSAGRHRISVQNEPGVDLVGSEKEIASALGNLVSNAVRYTPEGGEVRLRWRASPEGAAFDVEDTGIGIAPEHIARLSERFYRVDRGRSRETGGTGLGLAIAKHALMRHGAMLDIASTPGEGSRFTARFEGARVRAQ